MAFTLDGTQSKEQSVSSPEKEMETELGVEGEEQETVDSLDENNSEVINRPEEQSGELETKIKEKSIPVKEVKKKSSGLIELENVLSAGLDDLFLSLTDTNKIKFKEKGEDVAEKIQHMFLVKKISLPKVNKMLKEWLEIVPKNKYYLAQVAKIRTEKIMNMFEEYLKKDENI